MRYRFIEATQEAGLAYYASYYINGDASGLSDDEIADADRWLADLIMYALHVYAEDPDA